MHRTYNADMFQFLAGEVNQVFLNKLKSYLDRCQVEMRKENPNLEFHARHLLEENIKIMKCKQLKNWIDRVHDKISNEKYIRKEKWWRRSRKNSFRTCNEQMQEETIIIQIKANMSRYLTLKN